MRNRISFIFVIFCLTGTLISAVHLRTRQSRVFYNYRGELIEQTRLKQQLWQHQIEFERLTSPVKISK